MMVFTGFYLVLPSFNGFCWVFLGFNVFLLGFIVFYLVLPSFTEFYRVLLRGPGFDDRTGHCQLDASRRDRSLLFFFIDGKPASSVEISQ